jgi:hypothetical protein
MPQDFARGTNRIISLCLLCFLVAGCRSSSQADFTVAHDIAPQPPRVGQVTITLRVTDASGKAVTAARIGLEGNMSHAGMVPVFADAAEVEPGRYRANMELTMAGDWIVLVHLTLPSGEKVDRQFEITVQSG